MDTDVSHEVQRLFSVVEARLQTIEEHLGLNQKQPTEVEEPPTSTEAT